MSMLYNNNSVIGRLFQYFSAYFTSATWPTRVLLTWLLIGMLVLEGMPSIRWLYRHFLSQVYPKSLNCYYRACVVAKLDDICNDRYDSALFDLPPAPTGKRGRPAKRGKKLTLDDFAIDYVYDGFKIGHRRVMTNIFGNKAVNAYVTESASGSRRLFFCTADPPAISMACAWQEKESLRDIGSKDMEYFPLRLYAMRWNIEVGYYEQIRLPNWSKSYGLQPKCCKVLEKIGKW